MGWGSVAGPLYVVGVAVPSAWALQGLRDSKKLSRASRAALFEPLIDELRGRWELAIYSAEQIDKLGAQYCLIAAHTSVIQRLYEKIPMTTPIDRTIVDGNLVLPEVKSAMAIPHADDIFPAVAAASVIAKVLHDEAMIAYAHTYPQYGFERHVGYGVADHYKAIKRYGLCPLHRRSYLKKIIASS